MIPTSATACFDNNLCIKGDRKCNDSSICWDFSVFNGSNVASLNSILANLDAVQGFKIFSRGLSPLRTPLGGGGLRVPFRQTPQLYLGVLTHACSLRSLSQLGTDGFNCNFLDNALIMLTIYYSQITIILKNSLIGIEKLNSRHLHTPSLKALAHLLSPCIHPSLYTNISEVFKRIT